MKWTADHTTRHVEKLSLGNKQSLCTKIATLIVAVAAAFLLIPCALAVATTSCLWQFVTCREAPTAAAQVTAPQLPAPTPAAPTAQPAAAAVPAPAPAAPAPAPAVPAAQPVVDAPPPPVPPVVPAAPAAPPAAAAPVPAPAAPAAQPLAAADPVAQVAAQQPPAPAAPLAAAVLVAPPAAAVPAPVDLAEAAPIVERTVAAIRALEREYELSEADLGAVPAGGADVQANIRDMAAMRANYVAIRVAMENEFSEGGARRAARLAELPQLEDQAKALAGVVKAQRERRQAARDAEFFALVGEEPAAARARARASADGSAAAAAQVQDLVVMADDDDDAFGLRAGYKPLTLPLPGAGRPPALPASTADFEHLAAALAEANRRLANVGERADEAVAKEVAVPKANGGSSTGEAAAPPVEPSKRAQKRAAAAARAAQRAAEKAFPTATRGAGLANAAAGFKEPLREVRRALSPVRSGSAGSSSSGDHA
ncbi:MAG TPA: hypothetical protein VLF94_00445 [Chlamydiales bacterium]|nr:hypothetical protein [Chlamydiales bacterium]